jgi:hypothetical protein
LKHSLSKNVKLCQDQLITLHQEQEEKT